MIAPSYREKDDMYFVIYFILIDVPVHAGPIVASDLTIVSLDLQPITKKD